MGMLPAFGKRAGLVFLCLLALVAGAVIAGGVLTSVENQLPEPAF